ncbi:MAG: flavodoxin-dependent (E)-4-hydroxy-3-methylbut-2-enyl-diphosphate synthase [Candidatus Wallbacteria bacterium]|nr:flavodoxin-dependent (E)-4-hydroxy-3-methylbut-2-enyl-diphosphate synthase [Candidatus Wallbacteria bacterium]
MNKIEISVGNLKLGPGNPVRVQTMLNTDPEDYRSSLRQLRSVENRGAEIVRISVPTMQSVKIFEKLKSKARVPLVADIHFDHKMAISAIKAGADKVRINPGNIGDARKVAEVVKTASEFLIPIRIGVNSGSLPRDILKKHGHPNPEAMLDTMKRFVRQLEDLGFKAIILSAKTSSMDGTVTINRLLADSFPYPLHIGVTEAGPLIPGLLKSTLALSSLLRDCIGDTIRISLTSPPVDEVDAAIYLLKFLGLRKEGIEIISCPTCGRTKVDLISLVNKIYQRLPLSSGNLKLALMGCPVNGPGEAAEADIGLAFGPLEAVYFEKGVAIEKIRNREAIEYILGKISEFR